MWTLRELNRSGVIDEEDYTDEVTRRLRVAFMVMGLDMDSLARMMATQGIMASGWLLLKVMFPERVDAREVDFYVHGTNFLRFTNYLISHGYENLQLKGWGSYRQPRSRESRGMPDKVPFSEDLEVESQMDDKEWDSSDNDDEETKAYVPGYIYAADEGSGRLQRRWKGHEAAEAVYEMTRGGSTVNIIVITCKPLIHILQNFTTLNMNYLSAYAFVSLYPELTLRGIGIPNGSFCHSVALWTSVKCDIRQYGFLLKNDTFYKKHQCGRHPYCPQTIRTLYDENVLVVRYETDLQQPDDIHTLCLAKKAAWQLGSGRRCARPTHDSDGFVLVDSDLRRRLINIC